jgi:hypothetical protein
MRVAVGARDRQRASPDLVHKTGTLLEFQSRFAMDSACAEYLFARRWSEGFVCPGFGGLGLAVEEQGLHL